MLEKPLHGLNIAAAIGIAVQTADMTLFGGAGLAIGAALSSVSLFKKSDDQTRTAAKLMAPIIADELRRAPLSDDQKKIVLELLKDKLPTLTEIADGNNVASRIAAAKRQQIKTTVTDPAQTNSKVLNMFEAILSAALEPVVEPTDQQAANTAIILQRLDDGGEHQRMRDEGITEKAIFRLAGRIAQETQDLGAAWTALEDAVAVAIRVQTEGKATSNHRDFVDEVLARTQALAADGDYKGALDEIDTALQEEAARRARLLSRGVDMAKLAGDAAKATELLIQQLHLDSPKNLFGAVLSLQNKWISNGSNYGLAFDTKVAIKLAETAISISNDWNERGAAYNSLGNAKTTLNKHEIGTGQLLRAVEAYRNALSEHKLDRSPRLWAMTQCNLANALSTLDEIETGTERLKEAVIMFREVLQEPNVGLQQSNRLMVQMGLASTLRVLGERENCATGLKEAISMFREVLTAITPNGQTELVGAVQSNLSNALRALGKREAGSIRLMEAVDLYRSALEIRTQERQPLEWASTQSNLGITLIILGEREDDTALLEQAVTAFQNALKEWTQDKLPHHWAGTQNSLADVAIAFFDQTGDAAHLDAAQQYIADARAVFAEGDTTHYVEDADKIQAKIDARRA